MQPCTSGVSSFLKYLFSLTKFTDTACMIRVQRSGLFKYIKHAYTNLRKDHLLQPM